MLAPPSLRGRRTLDPVVSGIHDFQSCPFGLSGISPFITTHAHSVYMLRMSYGALNHVRFRAATHPTWCMAERVGFEPTSPCGRTAFRERRLKPTRQPLQNSANKPIVGSDPPDWHEKPHFVPEGGMCSVASLLPPPSGRRTHVSLRENPVSDGTP